MTVFSLQPIPCGPIVMPQYRIFFSHGGDDTYIVNDFLRPQVERTGATVFLDAGGIEYGEDFRRIIFAELCGCDELLVLLTPSSLKRPWVIAEIGAILVRGKRVVAIRYGPSEGELQELGILSLLGSVSLLRMDDFKGYVEQLTRRVAEYGHA
jgi:TIR domain